MRALSLLYGNLSLSLGTGLILKKTLAQASE